MAGLGLIVDGHRSGESPGRTRGKVVPQLSLQHPSGPSLSALGRLAQSPNHPESGSLLVRPGARVALQADPGHHSRYNPGVSESNCLPPSRLTRWTALNFQETTVEAKLAAPVDKVFGLLTDPKWLEARSLAAEQAAR